MPTTVSRVAWAGFLACVVYPLSFAPMLRAIEGPDFVYPEGTCFCLDPPTELPLWMIPYRPVIAMTQSTPLSPPLSMWADTWGVGLRVRTDAPFWLVDDGSLVEMWISARSQRSL